MDIERPFAARLQKIFHPDRSAAEWRDLRFTAAGQTFQYIGRLNRFALLITK